MLPPPMDVLLDEDDDDFLLFDLDDGDADDMDFVAVVVGVLGFIWKCRSTHGKWQRANGTGREGGEREEKKSFNSLTNQSNFK